MFSIKHILIRYLKKPVYNKPFHDAFADTENTDSYSLLSEEKDNNAFDDIVHNLFKDLMPHFAVKVDIMEHELEKRFLSVGMSMIPALNGFTFSSDNWKTFEIRLCKPLMLFFYQMSKLLVSRMEGWDDKKVYKRSPVKPKETISLTRKLMRSFWEDNELIILKKELPIERFNKDQYAIIGNLITGTECFCVAHELGHVSMKLCSTNLTELEDARAKAANLLETAYEVSGRDKEIVVGNWAEEFAADLIGLELSTNAQAFNIMKEFAYIGAESTFLMIDMLEDYYKKSTGVYPPIDTHPPGKARILNLRSTVSNPDLTLALQTSMDLERVCNVLLSRILPRKLFWLFAD